MYSLVSLPHHQCLLLILHLADGQKAHCIKQQDIIYTDVWKWIYFGMFYFSGGKAA